MKYWPTLLMSVMYAVGELWRCGSEKITNWFIAYSWPLPEQWHIKFASGQLQWIITAIMCLSYGKTPNVINRTSMIVFLLWTILDTISYFYNNKTYGYTIIYIILGVAWFVVYKYQTRRKCI